MVQWFDGSHLSKSPAQWDPAKLAWVNAQHLKRADDARLALLVGAQLARRGAQADPAWLERVCALFKDRCSTTVELADWAMGFLGDVVPEVTVPEAEIAPYRTDVTRAAIADFAQRLEAAAAWDAASIGATMKTVLAEHKLKMPQLAVPVRLLALGRAQTPSIDAVLALFDRAAICSARLTRRVDRAAHVYNPALARLAPRWQQRGGIAQLGERLHGMQEVSGSIPLTSTRYTDAAPSEQAGM